MKPLRDALEELVADVPSYGDLDRAIEQAEQDRRRRLGVMRSLSAAAAVLVVIGGTIVVTLGHDKEQDTGVTQPPQPTGAPLFHYGPLDPGRYRYVLTNACDDPPFDCPPDTDPPSPLDIEVTVPAGWQQLPGFPNVITRDAEDPTADPDGAALVLGWTNFHVGLHSNPCRTDDERPDIAVGPTVDDFVDAVQAHEALDVTKPSYVRVGGHPGRYFTLRAPSSLVECVAWRPWDPGFYAQGPRNIWNVWVLDVDGFRVMIVTNYFPGTPAKTRRELREMVRSITFGS